MKNKTLKYSLLIFVLGMQILLMAYYATEKNIHHVDETLSYGFANSAYLPWFNPELINKDSYTSGEYELLRRDTLIDNLKMSANYGVDVLEKGKVNNKIKYDFDRMKKDIKQNNIMGEWVDSECVKNYLVVNEKEKFDYFSVYYNTIYDAHPPLHHFIMHIISSLYPNIYSKYIGLSINFIFFILTAICIYKIGEVISKNYWFALISVFVYGFSIGAISSVMFVRMYMMLVFFSVLSLYLHIKFLEKHEVQMKYFVPVLVMGFLTQYYFLVYSFFLSICFICLMVLGREKNNLFVYLKSLLCSAIVGIGLFPFAIKHIFLDSQQGTKAFNNLLFSSYVENLSEYLKIVKVALLGNDTSIFYIISMICIAVMVIGGVFQTIKDNKAGKSGFNRILKEQYLFIILLPACCYFLLIAKIAPFNVDRYVMCIFPSLIISAIYFVSRLVQNKKWSRFICYSIIIIFAINNSINIDNVNYLYLDYNKRIEQLDEYKGISCIYIYRKQDIWRMYADFSELIKYNKILFIDENKLSQIDFNKKIESEYDVLIYIQENLNRDAILKDIKQPILNMKLINKDGSFIYELIKNKKEMGRAE